MKKLPLYGESIWHLLGTLFCYALVTYASIKLFGVVSLWIALAFPAGVIVHDFILFPAYRKLDNIMVGWQEKQLSKGKSSRLWINYVRLCVMISLLLLLCYFPIILNVSEDRHLYTGLTQESYLYRWLIVTGVFIAGSVFSFYRANQRAKAEQET
jgi:hypothetical protein